MDSSASRLRFSWQVDGELAAVRLVDVLPCEAVGHEVREQVDQRVVSDERARRVQQHEGRGGRPLQVAQRELRVEGGGDGRLAVRARPAHDRGGGAGAGRRGVAADDSGGRAETCGECAAIWLLLYSVPSSFFPLSCMSGSSSARHQAHGAQLPVVELNVRVHDDQVRAVTAVGPVSQHLQRADSEGLAGVLGVRLPEGLDVHVGRRPAAARSGRLVVVLVLQLVQGDRLHHGPSG